MTAMALRFVALDLGNVLCDLDVPGALARFQACTGAPPARVEAVLFESGLWHALEVGRVAAPEFRRGLANGLGVAIADAAFDACWNHVPAPRPGADALVARLALPHAIWSNTDPIHAEHLGRSLRALGTAAHRHLSFLAGARKPDAAYFRAGLAALGAQPHEVLFADDRPENLAAAAALGVVAEGVTTLAQLERALARHGVLRPA